MTDEQFSKLMARLEAIDKALAALQPKDDWISRLDPRKPFDSSGDAAGNALYKPDTVTPRSFRGGR